MLSRAHPLLPSPCARCLVVAQRVEWEATPAATLGEGKGQLETAEKCHTEDLSFQPRKHERARPAPDPTWDRTATTTLSGMLENMQGAWDVQHSSIAGKYVKPRFFPMRASRGPDATPNDREEFCRTHEPNRTWCHRLCRTVGRAEPHAMRDEFGTEVGDECGYITSSSVGNVKNAHVFKKLNMPTTGTTQKLHPK